MDCNLVFPPSKINNSIRRGKLNIWLTLQWETAINLALTYLSHSSNTVYFPFIKIRSKHVPCNIRINLSISELFSYKMFVSVYIYTLVLDKKKNSQVNSLHAILDNTYN